MKPAELIAKLKELPQDLDVVVWDVDYNYHHIDEVKEVDITCARDEGLLELDKYPTKVIVIAGCVYRDHAW